MSNWIIFKQSVVWGFGSTLGRNLSKGVAVLALSYLKKKTKKEETPEV